MYGYDSGRGITIAWDYMPGRTKPCLVIKEGNTETKYASFNNEEAAKLFFDKLAEMLNWEKIKYEF